MAITSLRRRKLPQLFISVPALATVYLTTMLPVVVVKAQGGQAATENQIDGTKPLIPGKIFVATRIVVPDRRDDTLHSVLLTIDPNTGQWQTNWRYPDREAVLTGIAVSPDRRFLAYCQLTTAGIWICPLNGKMEPVRLLEEPSNLVWSADGQQLLVSVSDWKRIGDDNVLRSETWLMNRDGGSRKKLPVPDTHIVQDWSSDGSWLLTEVPYRTKSGHGMQRADVRDLLYVMRLDGSEQRCLTGAGQDDRCGKFSPDGRQIAYWSLSTTEAWHYGIGVMGFDGVNRREVVRERELVRPREFCWSPDGKHFAVGMESYRWAFLGGRASLPERHIEIYDFAGRQLRVVKPEDVIWEYYLDIVWR